MSRWAKEEFMGARAIGEDVPHWQKHEADEKNGNWGFGCRGAVAGR